MRRRHASATFSRTPAPATVRVGERRLATWTWGAGPRILLVHGWGGRGGQMGAFVEPLVAEGFSVTAFDLPAHGRSEGRTATIPEMATALAGVLDAMGPVEGIVAHSGGGAVSAWAIRRALLGGFVDLPRAIALVAPAARFRAYFERFMDACGLSTRARSRLERRLEARVGAPPEVFDLTRFAQDLPLAALVVHDRDDAEIPWADGAADRGGLARRGARDDAPARPSPHPPGSGGRRAGEGLLRVRARIGPGGRPVRDRSLVLSRSPRRQASGDPS